VHGRPQKRALTLLQPIRAVRLAGLARGQVDNGPYRIINNNTVYIGSPPVGATFHYRILHGDTLMLSPVLTKTMLRQALAHPQKFSAAFWAVSVAYAGSSWNRVPCQNWC
jgi:hypothetical protein